MAELVRAGPDPAEHGVVRWRRIDLAALIEARFGVVLAERTVGSLLLTSPHRVIQAEF